MPKRKKEQPGPDYGFEERQERARWASEYDSFINEEAISQVLDMRVLTNREIISLLGYTVEENGIVTPAFKHLQTVLSEMYDRGDLQLATRHYGSGDAMTTEYRYYLSIQTYDLVNAGKLGQARWAQPIESSNDVQSGQRHSR